jgi:hypothetical protein
LKPQFVEHPLALVLDVEEGKASISVEANVEGKVHPRHILALCVNRVPCSIWSHCKWRLLPVFGKDSTLLANASPGTVNIGTKLDKTGRPVCLTELLGGLVENVVVQPSEDFPL